MSDLGGKGLIILATIITSGNDAFFYVWQKKNKGYVSALLLLQLNLKM